jgi:ATP-dependent protease ClpP protease subunit
MSGKYKIKFGAVNEKPKKRQKHNNDDDDDDDEGQFVLPKIFSSDDDETIYLKNNHLFFHDEVSKENIDTIKNLMREYYKKYKKETKKNYIVSVTPKPLYLHIYSGGGDIYPAFSLYDFINEYKKIIPVHTVIEGSTASAATIISQAGIKRYITPNSFMLIHQLSTFFGGNFEQIKDMYDECEKLMKRIKDIYVLKTKLSRNDLNNILKRDIKLTASDCVTKGLVDEIKTIDIFNDN